MVFLLVVGECFKLSRIIESGVKQRLLTFQAPGRSFIGWGRSVWISGYAALLARAGCSEWLITAKWA